MKSGRAGAWVVVLALGAAAAAVAWLGLDEGPPRRPEAGEGPARPPGLSGRGEPAAYDPANDAPDEDLVEEEVAWSGVVRDRGGRPVEGAAVLLGGVRGARPPLARATTDAEGRFSMRGRRGAGRSPLYAGGAGFLPSRVEVRRRGEEGIEVTLEPDTQRLAMSFRVVDAAGAPVPGLRGLAAADEAGVALREGWSRDLALAFDFDRACGAPPWDRAGFQSDAEGRVRLPSRLPGLLRVRALRDGDVLDASLRVPPPADDPEPVLRLASARRVAGRASVRKDPEWSCGHAAHRFEVLAPEDADGPWPALGISDADGRFRVAVPPRVRSVVVRTEGHPQVAVLLPAGEGDADVGDVEVPDARVVVGHIRFADGTPARHAVLVYGRDPERRAAADAGGAFRMEAAERPSRRDPARIEVPGLREPVPVLVDLAAAPLEVVLPAGVEPPPRRPEDDE